MVQTCYICKWRADKEPRRSFHKFPFDEAEKQKWLDIIGKSDASLGKRTSVCSIHFDTSCFRYGLVNGRELLRQGSVPTLQLTRPPEVDPYEDLYNVHQVDIEINLNPEEWNVPPDQEAKKDDEHKKHNVESWEKSMQHEITTEKNATLQQDVAYKPMPIEVQQTSKRKTTPVVKSKQNPAKINMDISKRKEYIKKQSLVRMLVERLRRDHVKLKNYIQSLEEMQMEARKRRTAMNHS